MFIAHDIWSGNPAWVAITEIRAGEWSREVHGSGRMEVSWEADDRALLVPREGREGLQRCATRSGVGECSYT